MTPLRCRLGLHAWEPSPLHHGAVHEHEECGVCRARRVLSFKGRPHGPIDFSWLGGGAASEGTSRRKDPP